MRNVLYQVLYGNGFCCLPFILITLRWFQTHMEWAAVYKLYELKLPLF